MKPEDNSLESGYDASAYSSSLEGKQAVSQDPIRLPAKAKRVNISLFKFNKIAILVTVSAIFLIFMVGGLAFIYDKVHTHKTPNVNSEEANGNYKVGSNLSVQQANDEQLLQIGQVNKLDVNGQLTVSKSLVLTPTTSTPSNPVTGEIYYDQSSGQPYYYNGSQFVSLQPSAVPEHVTSLGGTNGVIGLTNDLTINGGDLGISNSLLQSLSAAVANTSVVKSVQGSTGNVVFTAGLGISINGTSIGNGGVLSLQGLTGNVALTAGTGINVNGTSISNGGVLSLQGLTGNVALTAGTGISINGTSIGNSGVLSLSSSNSSIDVVNDGGGSYDLTLAGSTGVLLGPSTPQPDSSTNPSIFINKMASGDLLDLEQNGDPLLTVSSILGSSLNTSLSLADALSVNSGGESVDGGLGVSGGTTTDTLLVSGASSLQGDVSVQSQLTVGTNSGSSPTAGNLLIASGDSTVGDNGYFDIQAQGAIGSGTTTFQLPDTDVVAGGTYQFCVTNAMGQGNCSTTPDSSTVYAGTPADDNYLTEFSSTSPYDIIDSPIDDLGITDGVGTLTVGSSGTPYNLQVSTITSSAALSITPGGSLTAGVNSEQTTILGSSTSSLQFGPSSDAVTINLGTESFSNPETISFPDTYNDGLSGGDQSDATVCLENSSDCGFVTTEDAGVTALNTDTGALCLQDTLANPTCTGFMSGYTIAIQDAYTGGQLGLVSIASGSGTNGGLTISNAGVLDTVQNIQTDSTSVRFDNLSIGASSSNCNITNTGNICLQPAGTIYASNISNPSTSSANDLDFISPDSLINFDQEGVNYQFQAGSYMAGNTYDICVIGGSSSCATGSGNAVILEPSSPQTDDGDNPAIYLQQQSTGSCTFGVNCSDIIELENTTGADVFTVDQNGNEHTNNIEPINGSTGITLGSSSSTSTTQQFTLQGDANSEVEYTDSAGGQIYLGIGVGYDDDDNPETPYSGSSPLYFELDAGRTTAGGSSNPEYICTNTNGYCTSNGAVQETSATAGDIPYFQSSTNLENSLLSEQTSTCTNGCNIYLGTQGSGGSDANLAFYNTTNGDTISINSPTTVTTNDLNINLPVYSSINGGTGTLAIAGTGLISVGSDGVISCTDCASTGGVGGGATAVTSLNNGTAGNVTINNASGDSSDETIQINPALVESAATLASDGGVNDEGIAVFDSADFQYVGGLSGNEGEIDTIQGISATSTPTFKALTLGSSTVAGNLTVEDGNTYYTKFSQLSLLSSGADQTVDIPNIDGKIDTLGLYNSTDSTNLALQTSDNSLYVVSNPTFSVINGISSAASLAITPHAGDALTVGASSSQFTLSGVGGTASTGSSIQIGSGSNATTLYFATPSGDNQIEFPDAGSGEVCIGGSYNNCGFSTGSGLSGNGIIDSIAYWDSTTGTTLQSNQNLLFTSSSNVSAGISINSDTSLGSSSNTALAVNANGENNVNASTELNNGSGVNDVALVVQGNSGVTGDLLDLDNSSDNILDAFNDLGDFALNSGDLTSTASSVDLLYGSGATQQNIYLGNTVGTTALNLYAGTGKINLEDSTTAEGQLTVAPSTNSTTAFQVQNNSGTSIFNVDTTDNFAGTANTATASTSSANLALQSGNATGTTSNSGNVTIDVGTATGTKGSISIGHTNALAITIGNTSATTTVDGNLAVPNLATANTGEICQNTTNYYLTSCSYTYLYGNDSTIQSGNLNIQSAASTTAGAVIEGATSQSADLLDLDSDVLGSPSILDSFNSSGQLSLPLNSSITTTTYVCYNSDDQLSTCSSSGSTPGAAFVQGGNDFGLTTVGTLGTATGDDGALQLETDAVTRVTLDTSGNLNLANGSYEIGGSPVLSSSTLSLTASSSDTIEGASNEPLEVESVGTGKLSLVSGSGALSLQNSTTTLSTAGVLTLTGNQSTDITTSSSCGSSSCALSLQPASINTSSSTGAALNLTGGNETGSTSTGGNVVINSGTGTTNGNINIGTSGAYALTLQAGSGNLALTTGTTTGNISLTTNNASSIVYTKSLTNTTTAFEIQNTSGVSILTGDTTDDRIVINGGFGSSPTNTPTGQLYVGGQTPNEIGLSSTDLSSPESVYVSGSYAYVVNSSNNYLTVFNISNPASPTEVGYSSSHLGEPTSVYVSGSYAYVISVNDGLTIFNISNPANPSEVYTTTTDIEGTGSVYVSGSYAYVTSGSGSTYGLTIFNISNPASSSEVAYTTTGTSNPSSVYVSGSYAYVTSSTDGLTIFNISNPASPSEVANTTTDTANPISVYVSGSYAYVADYGNSRLIVFNISNPASPSEVGYISTDLSQPRSVYVQGRYAYVTSADGLTTFDVSTPASPTEVANTTTDLSSSSYNYSVYIQGRYAYVVNANSSSNELVDFDLGGEYAQQLQAGGAEVGTLTVDNDANINGDLGIQGGLTVGNNEEIDNSLGVAGSLGVDGAALFQDSASSYSAFQVNNNSGQSVIQVSDSGTSTVYIGYNSGINFDVDVNNDNGTIVIGDNSTGTGSDVIQIGTANGSAQTVTVGSTYSSSTLALAAGAGITANTKITQTVSYGSGTGTQTGTISLHGLAATDGNTTDNDTDINGVNITLTGTSNTGSQSACASNEGTNNCNVLSGISLNNVSAATNNTFYGIYFGTGYSSILQYGSTQLVSSTGVWTNTVQTTSTVQGSSVTATSTLTAGVSGSSPGSLVVYGTGGTAAVTLNTASIGTSYTLTLPTAAPGSTGECLADVSSTSQLGYIANCGSGIDGGVNANIVLNAEYVGAALDSASDSSCSSANIGTMTSGYSGSASTPPQNYYEWTTTQTSSQCYDVVVQVPLPSDFGSFPTTGPTFEIYGTNSSGLNSTAVEVDAVQCNGSSDPDFGSGYVGISTSTSWAQTTVSGSTDYLSNGGGTANYTSCGYLTLKIRLTATDSSGTPTTAQIGSIDIPYTTSTSRN